MKVEVTTLETLMNHIGILVKLLIKFAKKLQDFVDLPQASQVSLLKGTYLCNCPIRCSKVGIAVLSRL